MDTRPLALLEAHTCCKGKHAQFSFSADDRFGTKTISLFFLKKRVWLIHTHKLLQFVVTFQYLVEGATVMEQPHATTVPPFPFCGSKSIGTSFSVCRSVLHGSKYTHRSEKLTQREFGWRLLNFVQIAINKCNNYRIVSLRLMQ